MISLPMFCLFSHIPLSARMDVSHLRAPPERVRQVIGALLVILLVMFLSDFSTTTALPPSCPSTRSIRSSCIGANCSEQTAETQGRDVTTTTTVVSLGKLRKYVVYDVPSEVDDSKCERFPKGSNRKPRKEGLRERLDVKLEADERSRFSLANISTTITTTTTFPRYIADSTTTVPVRLAVCFAGRSTFSRTTDELVNESTIVRVATERWLNFQEMVLKPAKALHPHGLVEIDIFVQSSTLSFVAVLINLMNPKRIQWNNNISHQILGIQSVLNMMFRYSNEMNVAYDRVMLVRPDVLFMKHVDWTLMNPTLLYLPSWCVPTGGARPAKFVEIPDVKTDVNGSAVVVKKKVVACFGLSTFFHCSLLRGVPDFMFFGPPEVMSVVFGNMAHELSSCAFRPTKSCCFHAIVGGQLDRLYSQGKVVIGRYMFHHLDFDLHRFVGPERRELWKANATWVRANSGVGDPEVDEVWRPQRWSRCVSPRAYCRPSEVTHW